MRCWRSSNTGAPSGIERDDLAVEDRARRPEPGHRGEEAREVVPGVIAVPGERLDVPVVHDRLDPVAVPFHLEQPVGRIERLGDEGREHRLDEAGEWRIDGCGQVDLGDRGRRLGDPERVAGRLDLVVGPTGLDAPRVILRVPARRRVGVVLVDEQPRLTRIALSRPGLHDREPATDLLAVQAELELAVVDRLARLRDRWGRLAGLGLGRLGLPGPPIPDDDVAGAVLARRDDAFEVEVLDRVVLDVHRHPALGRIQGRAARHGPAHEDAVDLQAEVVVKARRPMALDDEPATHPRRRGRPGRPGRRFGRLAEVPFAAVFLEWHAFSVPNVARARPSCASRRAAHVAAGAGRTQIAGRAGRRRRARRKGRAGRRGRRRSCVRGVAWRAACGAIPAVRRSCGGERVGLRLRRSPRRRRRPSSSATSPRWPCPWPPEPRSPTRACRCEPSSRH